MFQILGSKIAYNFHEVHGKNDFADKSKILLDLKIILLELSK